MRPLCAGVLIALLALSPSGVRANGDPGVGPPTVFERFVLSACSPCIRESYPITSLAVPPQTLPASARAAAGVAVRSGEIAIEVLRAQQLGRPDWKSLALRVTLSVMPSPGGEMYRLGIGLLDGTDVRPLAQAVSEMTKIATAPMTNSTAESVDVDFHGGTLRIGVFRIRGDTVAYVQAGDLPTLMQRAVWEVPTTLYLSVEGLSTLAAALAQAAATMEKVRGN